VKLDYCERDSDRTGAPTGYDARLLPHRD